jgi:hypothetical protein
MSQHSDIEAWIPVPSTAEARSHLPPGTTFVYDYGFIPAMARFFLAHERIGRAALALFHQVMVEPGYLSRGEREMLAAVASGAQDCQY